MDLGLRDQVAVVTGASKGIGLALARALADEGARVIAAARTTVALEGIEGVTPVAIDLADPAGPGELIRRAIVNIASVTVVAKPEVGLHRPRRDRVDADPAGAAALAVMLAADRIGNVTGENVVIDGGLIKTT